MRRNFSALKRTLMLLTFLALATGCTVTSYSAAQKEMNLETTMERKEIKIITAFGDSLTAGYSLPPEQSYPSLLQNKLKEHVYNIHVINAGISGETTADGLRRIDLVIKQNPDLVILELGANDAFRSVPPVQVKKNLAAIIEKLKANGAEVLLAGMKAPRQLGKNYYTAFDAIYPELASEYNLELIPFFLEDVATVRGLNIPDGVHPNSRGYKIITETVWKHLVKML